MTTTQHNTILQTLTPTGRLIVKELTTATGPYSIANLCELTGATPGHLLLITRKLTQRGILEKTMNGTCSMYALSSELAAIHG